MCLMESRKQIVSGEVYGAFSEGRLSWMVNDN